MNRVPHSSEPSNWGQMGLGRAGPHEWGNAGGTKSPLSFTGEQCESEKTENTLKKHFVKLHRVLNWHNINTIFNRNRVQRVRNVNSCKNTLPSGSVHETCSRCDPCSPLVSDATFLEFPKGRMYPCKPLWILRLVFNVFVGSQGRDLARSST